MLIVIFKIQSSRSFPPPASLSSHLGYSAAECRLSVDCAVVSISYGLDKFTTKAEFYDVGQSFVLCVILSAGLLQK